MKIDNDENSMIFQVGRNQYGLFDIMVQRVLVMKLSPTGKDIWEASGDLYFKDGTLFDTFVKEGATEQEARNNLIADAEDSIDAYQDKVADECGEQEFEVNGQQYTLCDVDVEITEHGEFIGTGRIDCNSKPWHHGVECISDCLSNVADDLLVDAKLIVMDNSEQL